MKIYIDSEFHCHTTNPDKIFREFEVDFFDKKCNTFIEGYIFVPPGESYKRSDDVTFYGKMISPWKNYDELDVAQREYERELLADAEKALAILLGGTA